MGATRQVAHAGTKAQLESAQQILRSARKSLYQLLADDDAGGQALQRADPVEHVAGVPVHGRQRPTGTPEPCPVDDEPARAAGTRHGEVARAGEAPEVEHALEGMVLHRVADMTGRGDADVDGRVRPRAGSSSPGPSRRSRPRGRRGGARWTSPG